MFSIFASARSFDFYKFFYIRAEFRNPDPGF